MEHQDTGFTFKQIIWPVLIILVVIVASIIIAPRIKQILGDIGLSASEIDDLRNEKEYEFSGSGIDVSFMAAPIHNFVLEGDKISEVKRLELKEWSTVLNANQLKLAKEIGDVEYFFTVKLYRDVNGEERLFTNDLIHGSVEYEFSVSSTGSVSLIRWDGSKWVRSGSNKQADGKYIATSEGTGLLGVVVG